MKYIPNEDNNFEYDSDEEPEGPEEIEETDLDYDSSDLEGDLCDSESDFICPDCQESSSECDCIDSLLSCNLPGGDIFRGFKYEDQNQGHLWSGFNKKRNI